MLARASTTEVVSGYKNLKAFVHLEIRTILEQVGSNARLVRNLQKSRGNNLIGIDIDLRKNNNA
jgi:hypothetical protein